VAADTFRESFTALKKTERKEKYVHNYLKNDTTKVKSST
jgi:hypothetical protein